MLSRPCPGGAFGTVDGQLNFAVRVDEGVFRAFQGLIYAVAVAVSP